MTESNRFINSTPRQDVPLCDGDTENNDLTNWNDTPPHENGEGPDGCGMDVIEKEMPPQCGCECARPYAAPEEPAGSTAYVREVGGASYEEQMVHE